MKDLSKKRGNFILSGKFAGKYKCFNCGAFMNINKVFERYEIPLSLDSVDYLNSHQTSLEAYGGFSMNASTNINYLFDEEVIEQYAISKENLMNLCNLLPCSVSDIHRGATYIKNRHLSNFDNYLYEPQRELLFILNLTAQGNVLGFQIRRLKPKKGQSKYMTYSTKSIYKLFLKNDDIEVPDSVDTLSMMFNIFKIDLNKPIFVTEGPFDSYFLPNCIATTGANKTLQLDFPYWFVYDSDKTGNKHAIERIQQGYFVFLWDKLKKDYCLPKREKWDISDFVDYCFKNKINVPKNWNKYFSNDIWDVLDI